MAHLLSKIARATVTHRIFRPLEFSADAQRLAGEGNFELKGYKFSAAKEETRPPRIIRVAVVQNQIVKPTTASIKEQVQDMEV